MQAETCCSLPRTPAICSTDCTETHTASAAATPLGERVTRGSATSSGPSPLYVLIALTCLCWLGSPGNPTNNLIIYTKWQTADLQYVRQAARATTQKERKRKEANSMRSILMFVFDRWGMPPIDFVREARTGVERVKPGSNSDFKLWSGITRVQEAQLQPQ